MKAILASILPLVLCAAAAVGQAAATQTPEADEAARLSAQAASLYNRGKYDEAAPLAEQAVAAWERARGAEHADVAKAHADLGAIRIGQGRFADAELSLARSVAVYEKVLKGPDIRPARALSSLAVARYKQGHVGDAAKLAKRSVQTAEAALGPDDVGLADLLKLAADLQRLTGDSRPAEENYLRAIKLWVKAGMVEDARVGISYESLMCMFAGGGSAKQRELKRKLDDALGREPPTGGDMNGKAISKPPPPYPEAAMQMRIQGGVVVKIWVNEAGGVTRAQAVCGHPVLAQASVAAAWKARFTPTIRGGEPVKVTGYITYNFFFR